MGQIKEVNVLKQEKGVGTLTEQLKEAQLQLESMQELFLMLKKAVMGKNKTQKSDAVPEDDGVYNKDGVPLNSSYIGYTRASEYPYILVVNAEGTYCVGNNKFPALSASAEFVSGVRRSGWTFWCLIDGRTLKEVYKKKKK